MKKMLMLTAGCAIAIAASATLQAQENKPAPNVVGQSSTPGKLTPLRVQLVISRFSGEKKIASLPYTLWVTANETSRTSVRMGSDVPVVQTVFGASTAGDKDKASIPQRSYSYKNVGTHIDCTASSAADGAFRLVIVLNDSSIQFDPKGSGQSSAAGMADAPVFRNFSSDFRILLRDGQTAQYTSATDPVSGEVLKVDVTLNVLK